MKTHADAIRKNGKFLDDAARARVLDVHREAIANFEKRLARETAGRSR